MEWLTLVAGLVGGGFVTEYVRRASDRRVARADLLGAQRKLAAARRQGVDSIEDAAHEVLRLGIIAGVPQWLNRRYRDVAVAEWRIKQRVDPQTRRTIMDEVGEIEAISHMALIDSPETKEWVEIMDEYRWTGEIFEYAVWHPFRSWAKSISWHRKAKRFEKYRIALVTDGPGE